MAENPFLERVDVVVVGSGFGGSVAAYRLAEAGRSVVVLERGRAYPPGSFPRTPAAVGRNFWEPAEGRHGLFDVWTFHGVDGLVSSGLGGGSLIYANVLLRKDEKWFVHEQALPGGGYEHWPISRADLDEHYDAVEAMIGTSPYPYPDTLKTKAVREAAEGAGMSVLHPPLAVSFSRRPGEDPVRLGEIPASPYGNLHGMHRVTCALTAECVVGCNRGAKNSLDHTYLSAASHAGADIRIRHEVMGFRRLPSGTYEVSYIVHTGADGEPAIGLPTRTLRCNRLVLAAGAFGTTYLLLRNRTAFPGLSAALGTRFSGNGDLLGFVMNAVRDGDGYNLEPSTGPVITTAIRVPDAVDGDGASGRGHYIQDAGFPAFAAWIAETDKSLGALARAFRFGYQRAIQDITESGDPSIGGELATVLGPGSLTATMLPLLGMGRDIPDGVMKLRNGRLDVEWKTETSMEYFESVRASMGAIARQLGGTYADNPLWWGKRVITVHPLGGAPMGRHPGEGVCDEYGEVYGYPGLYVMDGALLPGPVGANPALTIAAVADRACTQMLDEAPAGARAPLEAAKNLAYAALDPVVEAVAKVITDAGTGHTARALWFTEWTKGFVALGDLEPETGHRRGKLNRDRLMVKLTISIDDVDKFLADRNHSGSAEGHVESDVLGGRLEVERGWFNLFVLPDDPDARQMLYRLWLRGPGGNPITFTGVKQMRDQPGLDIWRDISTLYVRMLDGHLNPGIDDGQVLAAGVITIHVRDFINQLASFSASADSPLGAKQRFGRLFLGQLWNVYGQNLRDEEDEAKPR